MRSAFFTLIFLSLALHISGNQENGDSLECDLGSVMACYNKPAAMRLKIISIAAILVTSMLGICLPLFTRSIPALHPEKDLFVVVKAFASGVILATGYMHVMPDSFDCLKSQCLPANPWAKFPFTTFVAMLSAIVTLMVDSFTLALYRKSDGDVNVEALVMVHPTGTTATDGSPCQSLPKEALHLHQYPSGHEDEKESSLLRFRVVAQVLEVGIIVHSVVIGLSLGASENPCTIRPLIAALCFHQMFEGMGLGGCILQAEYGMKMKAIMVFFFSFTTPLGIALGIGLSNVYSDKSPTALIVVGLLNACSAGLLNYMALVNLLAVDFMGRKLQSRIKLQIWSYVAVLLGAGGMSVMAIWA